MNPLSVPPAQANNTTTFPPILTKPIVMAQQTLFHFFSKGKGGDSASSKNPTAATSSKTANFSHSQVVNRKPASVVPRANRGKNALLKKYDNKKRKRSDPSCTSIARPSFLGPDSTSSAPSRKKRKIQSYIDAGQASLKSVTCQECGLLYMRGEENDEALHKKYHASMSGIMKWKQKVGKEATVWRGEDEFGDVLKEGQDFEDDFIVKVDCRSDAKLQEKTRNIDIRIGSLLGCSLQMSVSSSLASSNNFMSTGQSAFLYVRRDEIIAVATCERIQYGFESGSLSECSSGEIDTGSRRPCLMGVRRIWTSSKCRKTGIASHLLNICRQHLIHGFMVKKQQVAFTYPTNDGRAFILKWMNTVGDEDDEGDESPIDKDSCNIYVPEGFGGKMDSGSTVGN